jgi:hypothetical protein
MSESDDFMIINIFTYLSLLWHIIKLSDMWKYMTVAGARLLAPVGHCRLSRCWPLLTLCLLCRASIAAWRLSSWSCRLSHTNVHLTGMEQLGLPRFLPASRRRRPGFSRWRERSRTAGVGAGDGAVKVCRQGEEQQFLGLSAPCLARSAERCQTTAD